MKLSYSDIIQRERDLAGGWVDISTYLWKFQGLGNCLRMANKSNLPWSSRVFQHNLKIVVKSYWISSRSVELTLYFKLVTWVVRNVFYSVSDDTLVKGKCFLINIIFINYFICLKILGHTKSSKLNLTTSLYYLLEIMCCEPLKDRFFSSQLKSVESLGLIGISYNVRKGIFDEIMNKIH